MSWGWVSAGIGVASLLMSSSASSESSDYTEATILNAMESTALSGQASDIEST